MPPLHLLIKPASSLCNLRCAYCFYHDVAARRAMPSFGIMTEATLQAVLRRAFDYAQGSLTIAFQGGEPTLAGLGFFRAAARLQGELSRPGLAVRNAIQTNGYGLGEEWARFFRENDYLVGLSLDGRPALNDRHRVDARGEGTSFAVMKTAELLSRHGVEYNILAVVTRQMAARAAETYAFFKKSGFRYLQFIPCLDPLGEPAGAQPYSLAAALYGRFLCETFDLWHGDFLRGEGISIRDFDNYVQMAAGYPPESCSLRGVCGAQNVVEADGSVYPCDFYVLDEMRLGNLLRDDFPAIHRRREELRFIERSREIADDCRACDVYGMCRAGCFRHREGGKSVFCEAYRMFFAHARDGLSEIARVALGGRKR